MIRVSAVTFTANNDDKRKDTEKKVVTGGGAAAAAGATVTRRPGFDMFKSSQKLTQGMNKVTSTVNNAQNVVKKSTTLWGRVCENAKWAKGAILNWGAKFKNMKYVRPLIENPAFRFCAGSLGVAFGLITMISGLADVTKVATDAVNGQLSNKE
jgi:hypothetical protein